jgi:hypothetical protein
MTTTYTSIARTIENSHIGKTDLFLYPIPKRRKLRSRLYIIDGRNALTIPNKTIKTNIATKIIFSFEIKL